MQNKYLKIIGLISIIVVLGLLFAVGFYSDRSIPSTPNFLNNDSQEGIELTPPENINEYFSKPNLKQYSDSSFDYNILRIDRFQIYEPYFQTLLVSFPDIIQRFDDPQIQSQVLIQEKNTKNTTLQPANVQNIVQIKIDGKNMWLVTDEFNSISITEPNFVNALFIDTGQLNISTIISIKEYTLSNNSKALVQFSKKEDINVYNNPDTHLAILDFNKDFTEPNFISEIPLYGFGDEIAVQADNGLIVDDLLNNSISQIQNPNGGTDALYNLSPSWTAELLPSGNLFITTNFQINEYWYLYTQTPELGFFPEKIDIPNTSNIDYSTCSTISETCWVIDFENQILNEINLDPTNLEIKPIIIEDKDVTKEKIFDSLKNYYNDRIFYTCYQDQALCVYVQDNEVIIQRLNTV